MQPRPILLRGQPLAGGRLPAVCAPLVGRTRAALLEEVERVAAKRPDLLEWRVDFFEDIAATDAVLSLAGALRERAAGVPLLFTRRARREGGEPISLDEPQVVALYEAVCASGLVELLDFEMGNAPEHVARVRAAAERAGLGLVLSFHDFQGTPRPAELLERFAQAERQGASLAKLAVMPQSMEDVHALLGATLMASRNLRIPVAGMAMGPLGAVSRLCGGAFGSALTFAVGSAASAPGQVPIEEVRLAVAVLQRAMAGQG